MSQTLTPCRTMPPPKTRTKANTSHSTRRPASGTHQFYSHLPPTCCMHVHQQQSQTCRLGEPPALREVKHPHKGRTSVSRSPSTEQEVLSQFSGYSEEIGHFTRDPCKSYLKSCLQSTKHAFKKQEVNTHTDCEHSYRMEHAKHFQHLWKCAWMTTTPRPQREPNDSTFKILDMQNSHQAWKVHQSFQETSSNREMKKSWIQVHLH